MRVSPVSPSPDQRPPEDAGRRDAPNTLRIQDFGDEVHLWVQQRVPWWSVMRGALSTPGATRFSPSSPGCGLGASLLKSGLGPNPSEPGNLTARAGTNDRRSL